MKYRNKLSEKESYLSGSGPPGRKYRGQVKASRSHASIHFRTGSGQCKVGRGMMGTFAETTNQLNGHRVIFRFHRKHTLVVLFRIHYRTLSGPNRRLGFCPLDISHEILLKTALRWRLGGKEAQPAEDRVLRKLWMVVKEIEGVQELGDQRGQLLHR